MNDLSARLRHRIATEGRKMDEIAERELRAFGETLSGGAKYKLHTIDAAMEEEIGRIHGLLRRGWLPFLVIGLLILLVIFGASWGLMQWQLSHVQRLLETQETYRRAIAQAQQDLALLQEQTWGVQLFEAADGTRHVLFPKGTFNEDWPWTVQGWPAVPLSSE